jgi:hypothetical protein
LAYFVSLFDGVQYHHLLYMGMPFGKPLTFNHLRLPEQKERKSRTEQKKNMNTITILLRVRSLKCNIVNIIARTFFSEPLLLALNPRLHQTITPLPSCRNLGPSVGFIPSLNWQPWHSTWYQGWAKACTLERIMLQYSLRASEGNAKRPRRGELGDNGMLGCGDEGGVAKGTDAIMTSASVRK